MCDNYLTPYVVKENNTVIKYSLADVITQIRIY